MNFSSLLRCAIKLGNSSDKTFAAQVWRRREQLAKPLIQRFERPIPKVFYAPDWQIDQSEKDKEYNPLKGYGVTPEKWEYYNKVVWPKGYIVPETGLPKTKEVFHCRESVHYYPKRMWNACHFVRRMNAQEALVQLRFKQNKGCFILAEVIEEAMARAKKEFYVERPDEMYVAEAFYIQNNIIKGRRRNAKENWTVLRYRYINIFVRLEEGKPPVYAGRAPEINAWDQMRDYYEYLRNRSIKYSL